LMKVKFNPDDKAKAVVQMDSVAHQIQVDSLNFDDAVKRFSDDEKSKINKGVVTNSSYERYGARYKTNMFTKEELGRLFDKIGHLNVNQVSDSFEFTDDALEESVMIVKLLKTIPSHTANIDNDYTVIEEMAKAERQTKKFDKWLNEKIDEMYVRIEEPYNDIKLANSRWKK
ncbi:MAG: peptidylprolyl isomerase, partial [Rikenellaceae bacterium]